MLRLVLVVLCFFALGGIVNVACKVTVQDARERLENNNLGLHTTFGLLHLSVCPSLLLIAGSTFSTPRRIGWYPEEAYNRCKNSGQMSTALHHWFQHEAKLDGAKLKTAIAIANANLCEAVADLRKEFEDGMLGDMFPQKVLRRRIEEALGDGNSNSTHVTKTTRRAAVESKPEAKTDNFVL